MTSYVGRLYALAASILGLFLAWAGVTAAPWPAKTPPAAQPHDSGTAALLTAYEQRLRRDSALIGRILKQRSAQPPPAAPQVQVVTAPPVATTRTS